MSYCTLSKVSDQIQQYFNHPNTRALATSTQKLYHGVAKNKLIPFCRLKNISQLDESFVGVMDEYADFIKFKTSARTTASYLTISKIFFRFHGIQLKHTYRIPRKDKQENDLKHERRWFSAEDIEKCLAYQHRVNHNRNHLLVRLLIETGARVDEIAHIYAGDVNIFKKTVLLSHSKTIPRPVFFKKKTTFFMEKHLRENFYLPSDKKRFIFPSKNMIYKIVVEMLENLKLKQKDDGRGPHTFRHYTATHLRFVENMDIYNVATLLGDSVDTIRDCYLHPTPDMLHSVISKAAGY